MDQNTFIFLYRILNEIKYGFSCGVFLIKYNLVLKIKPLKCEINDSSAFEEILDLFSCTVNDMRNFVSYYKFLVLQVSKKKWWIKIHNA